MQEQLGREPDMDKCPPGAEDFPEITQIAIVIFHSLGNRIYPDIGYMGKDYTNLPILLNIFDVDNVDLVMETLSRLDAHAIKQSQAAIKREHDKIKRKSRG